MFGWFSKKESATIAKDRLKIAIMTDRDSTTYPFMEEMEAEIIEVVKKYTRYKKIEIKKEIDGDIEGLSIEVQLDRNEMN